MCVFNLHMFHFAFVGMRLGGVVVSTLGSHREGLGVSTLDGWLETVWDCFV